MKKKEYDYTLNSLANIFAQHAIEVERIHIHRIKDFEETYPDTPIPSELLDDFNLPKALECICREILQIKEIE